MSMNQEGHHMVYVPEAAANTRHIYADDMSCGLHVDQKIRNPTRIHTVDFSHPFSDKKYVLYIVIGGSHD